MLSFKLGETPAITWIHIVSFRSKSDRRATDTATYFSAGRQIRPLEEMRSARRAVRSQLNRRIRW